MKIPKPYIERSKFIQDVLACCIHTREARRSAYRTLKQYYMFGAEMGNNVGQELWGTVNKIWNQVDKSSSMLYAPDSTRFEVEIDRSVNEKELDKCPPLTSSIMDTWQNSNSHNQFSLALEWSFVYGSTFLKARPKSEDIICDVVMPGSMGVYREDLIGLEAQEAISHEYYMTKSDLLYQATLAGLPNPESIVAAAIDNVGADEDESVVQQVDQIATSSALPNVTGQLNTSLGSRISYRALIKQAMVRMYELYVWDDELEDYQVFTIAHPNVPVFDRPIDEMFLPHELPFTQVCPFPLYGYFYGIAPVERLLNLQMLRNVRWDQVQHMMEMQATPASVITGDLTAEALEVQDALDTPGGMVVTAQGGDAKKLAPLMPDDLFAEVNYLDTQFDDVMGTTAAMSGKGEPGVRSEGHAQNLLSAGSTRAKKRALIIEQQLEELATLYLKIKKKYSKRTYVTEEGLEFLAEQFTDEFAVRVDAHSSSPVFMTDQFNLVVFLFKNKMIERESALDMLPVPMRDLLKRKLKLKIEPAEARAQKQQTALELATGKVSKIGGKGK